jgi:hypothetical protein
MDANPHNTPKRLVATVTGALGATAGVLTVSAFLGPADAATMASLLAPEIATVLALVVSGALLARIMTGAVGWAATTAGSAVGLMLHLGVLASLATELSGMSVPASRDEFIGAVVPRLAWALVAVAVGYWGSTAVLWRTGRREPLRPEGPAVGMIALTMAAIPVVAFGAAAWLSTTPVRVPVDDASVRIVRITISEDAIYVDQAVIPAGEATILVTVVGDAPPDLTLVDVAGATVHGLGTPPSGSVDYYAGRVVLTRGRWYVAAGLREGVDPGVGPADRPPAATVAEIVVAGALPKE